MIYDLTGDTMAGADRTATLLLALTVLVTTACHSDARDADRILQQSACDKLRHLGMASSEHAQGMVTEQWRLRQHAKNTLELTELSDELAQSRFGQPLRAHRDRVDRAFVTQNMVGAGQREAAPPWADISADAEALWDEFDCPGDRFEAVTAVVRPAPAVECRELGGGWRWEGSRDRGTTSVRRRTDRGDVAADPHEATLTAPPIDDDEWAARREERAASGWIEERVRGLSYLGVDHRIAADRGFDGNAAEFAEMQEDLEQRLDKSPSCHREGPTEPSG